MPKKPGDSHRGGVAAPKTPKKKKKTKSAAAAQSSGSGLGTDDVEAMDAAMDGAISERTAALAAAHVLNKAEEVAIQKSATSTAARMMVAAAVASATAGEIAAAAAVGVAPPPAAAAAVGVEPPPAAAASSSEDVALPAATASAFDVPSPPATGVEGPDDFLPSEAFVGQRAGRIFKRGASGVGYYRDVQPTTTAAPAPATIPAEGAPLAAQMGGPREETVEERLQNHISAQAEALGLLVPSAQSQADEVARLRSALAERRVAQAADEPETLSLLVQLCSVLEALGDLDEPTRLLEDALGATIRNLAEAAAASTEADATSLPVEANPSPHPEEAAMVVDATSLPLPSLTHGALMEAVPSAGSLPTDPHAELPLPLVDALSRLAALRAKAGEREAAVPLARSVVYARRAQLGTTHAQTMSSMAELALLLRKVGDVDGALPVLRELLQARRDVLGEAHPETLGCLSTLGQALHEVGDTKSARLMLSRAAKGALAALGPDHPKTKSYQRALARVGTDADASGPTQMEMRRA